MRATYKGIPLNKEPSEYSIPELSELVALYLRTHCDENGFFQGTIASVIQDMFGEASVVSEYKRKEVRGLLRMSGFKDWINDNGRYVWRVPDDILNAAETFVDKDYVSLYKNAHKEKVTKLVEDTKAKKNYSCKVCGKSFGDNWRKLGAHVNTHRVSDLQKRLIALIESTPGISSVEMAKVVGKDTTTVYTSLNKVIKKGLVKKAGEKPAAGGHGKGAARYWPPNYDLKKENGISVALKEKTEIPKSSDRKWTCPTCGGQFSEVAKGPHSIAHKISAKHHALVGAVKETPGLYPRNYDKMLGWPTGTSAKIYDKLVREGYVVTTGNQNGRRLHPSEKIRANRAFVPTQKSDISPPPSHEDFGGETIKITKLGDGQMVAVIEGKLFKVNLEEVSL